VSLYRDYFKILGLDAPPKTRKAIKLAYSKKLKVTRPEDDPEGFMLLRDAHDYALQKITREALYAERVKKTDVAEPETSEEVQGNAEEKTPPSLSYEDMLPPENIEPPVTPSPTAYSSGPKPSLDAPILQRPVASPTFVAPEDPLKAWNDVRHDLADLLSEPAKYNDRRHWNRLFRKARQLDLDSYTDFEAHMLDRILALHGYYSDEALEKPAAMPRYFSPSIAASLFKTMHWDQLSHFGGQQEHQIGWLSQRMGLNPSSDRVATLDNLPTNVSQNTGLARWFWPALGIISALALLADYLH